MTTAACASSHLRWLALLPVLMASLLCPGRSHAGVLLGPVTNQINGHRYYLLAPSSWTDAETEAVTLGGHLVTINDEQENRWVAETFGEFGEISRALWTGLFDADNQGTYTWVSGDPSDFRFWFPNDPADPTGTWNHVHIVWYSEVRLGRWRPWEDSSHRQGIPISGVVEVAPPPTNPTPAILSAVEIVWESATNAVYRVQWASDLGSGQWFDLGSAVPGTGGFLSVFDRARGRSQRFYRVTPVE